MGGYALEGEALGFLVSVEANGSVSSSLLRHISSSDSLVGSSPASQSEPEFVVDFALDFPLCRVSFDAVEFDVRKVGRGRGYRNR